MHALGRQTMAHEFGAHVRRGGQNRGVTAKQRKADALLLIVVPHTPCAQTAASMGIVMYQTSPAEARCAGARPRRGKHFAAADAGAVIAVSEEHGRRDFDYSRRAR